MSESVLTLDSVVDGRHGPVKIRRYGAASSDAATLIWLHGGGFTAGGLDQKESDAPARQIATAGRPVVTVDYSLVPQWSPFRKPRPPMAGVRYPIPLDDVLDVVHVIRDESPRYVLGGASAGAALSASAVKRMVAEGVGLPIGVVLAYGMFHSTLPPLLPELRSRVRGRYGILQFNPRIVEIMNLNYLGSQELMTDSVALPGGHGELADFPATLMVDADRDTLRASSSLFRDELLTDGVDLTYLVVADSLHGFFDKPEKPSFAEGMAAIGSFLDTLDPPTHDSPITETES